MAATVRGDHVEAQAAASVLDVLAVKGIEWDRGSCFASLRARDAAYVSSWGSHLVRRTDTENSEAIV